MAETEDYSFSQRPVQTIGDQPYTIEKTHAIDVKLSQLEVKVESLKWNYTTYLELLKWGIVALITVVGILITAGILMNNFVTNDINTYKELHNQYYKELIQIQYSVDNKLMPYNENQQGKNLSFKKKSK